MADEFDCEWDVSGKLEAVDLGVTSDYLCSYSSDRLLTDIDGLTFEDAYERLAVQISNLYKEHTYLLESERMDSDDRTLFKELKSGSAGKIQIGQSLHTMSTALKDNTTLRFAVITGCLKIAKESIFTGTNNFVPDNITDSRFNEYFGFTQEEVD